MTDVKTQNPSKFP